jgi:hypothetical protein
MDWTELYPFLFGIGLIAAVMLAYGLGLHVGKRQERVAISRKRWKQKQFLIGRHQTEREQYLEKIRFLEKELGRISQESADYQQKLDDIAFYRQKILICEQQIKQLSSAETEHPGLSLLLQLKEDPQHTNLSRQEWETLFAFTDLLFNNTLSSLQEKYNLTRHEQEICCLLKWQFSRKEQLAVFNNTSEALAKSKNRLKKHLQLDDKTDLDWFVWQQCLNQH